MRAQEVWFALRIAAREVRHGWRRFGVYGGSIALGVAALVAIHSFRDDVARSVRAEAQVLLGADARFSSDRPFPDTLQALFDSLVAEGTPVARVTRTTSMVLEPRGGTVRLLQIRAVDPGYPFYGTARSEPSGLWQAALRRGQALVDPAVLIQLGASVGDTLLVGRARVPVAGTVEDLPSDPGFQAALGPRVFISHEVLGEAELLGFGSLAEYEVYVRMPDAEDRARLRARVEPLLEGARARLVFAEERAQSLANGIRFLGRFLSLVGLGALLLGAVGVASALHVFAKEKRDSAAVLRCLGCRQTPAFLAYLSVAVALGGAGSVLGVALGVGAQHLLPTALAGWLPVDVRPTLSPASAGAGLAVGVWVSVVFSVVPLLAIRDVSPLQALRRDVEPSGGGRGLRTAAWGALAASVLAVSAWEAPQPALGLAFAGALFGAVAVLAAVAWVLVRAARRFLPSGAPYPVRQGVSNLFRPGNQTLLLTLALGFATFVVGTVLQVERSVRADLTLSVGEGRPNLLLFDVQADQVPGVLALLPDNVRGDAQVSPLVVARIAEVNGRTPDVLRAEADPERRPEAWALRREYRATYRSFLGGGERLVAGSWWSEGGASGTEPPGVSLEVDVARSLRVGLGDTVVWNVGGVEVPTVVRSLREVDWTRLEPNFFAVMEPGAVNDAPQTALILVRIPDARRRAEFQRALIQRFPNVSALDFSAVQRAVETVFSRVRHALAFLGGFTALAGLVVLAGALRATRMQRQREGALLRTLGAHRRQLLAVVAVEYATLGSVAVATGGLCSVLASAWTVGRLFDLPFRPAPLLWLSLGGSVLALTLVVGFTGSRGLLNRPPMASLREALDV